MKKIILISAAMLSIMVSGCSIQLGGTTEPSNVNNVVYDCSAISDQAHIEMTIKNENCGKGNTIFHEECREQVIKSTCKPIFKDKN